MVSTVAKSTYLKLLYYLSIFFQFKVNQIFCLGSEKLSINNQKLRKQFLKRLQQKLLKCEFIYLVYNFLLSIHFLHFYIITYTSRIFYILSLSCYTKCNIICIHLLMYGWKLCYLNAKHYIFNSHFV